LDSEHSARRVDVLVAGAGSGGIGAALAAARQGCEVLLVERDPVLGGNAVRSGVSCWEPGVGGTGIPFEIYGRLARIPDAVGVYSYGRHALWQGGPPEKRYPGGEHVVDRDARYIDTLQRHSERPVSLATDEAHCRAHWHGVVFEPQSYVRVVTEMLAETKRCTVRTGVKVCGVSVEGDRVTAVRLSDGAVIHAGSVVDCTGDGVVCSLAGCSWMSGQDSQSRFGEPSAPAAPTKEVNGATLVYRISPAPSAAVEDLPDGVPDRCWWRERFPSVSAVQYPCGDWNMNMLPTLEGRLLNEMGERAAYREAIRRVRAHWHALQIGHAEFRDYCLSWIAPRLGVRESRRIVGEVVLTERDLRAGLERQGHDDVIALADHAIDMHGVRGAHGNLRGAYGVSYRCLIPRGYSNLLIACRAASFSSLAASSCRLSRTMIQLGQAAGTAAAIARRMDVDVARVPIQVLRDSLREQYVQLEWPLTQRLRAHLDQDPRFQHRSVC